MQGDERSEKFFDCLPGENNDDAKEVKKDSVSVGFKCLSRHRSLSTPRVKPVPSESLLEQRLDQFKEILESLVSRVNHMGEEMENFQHAIGHSLTAIDNDLCRLENRVAIVERNACPVQDQLMLLGCEATFRSDGGALAITAFAQDMLFISTGNGNLDVWEISPNPPVRRLSLVLSDVLTDFNKSTHSSPKLLLVHKLVVIQNSRQRGLLFAGLSDGSLALFNLNLPSKNKLLKLAQIWPESEETEWSSESVQEPVGSLEVSPDQSMLAFSRGCQFFVKAISPRGFDSSMFSYKFRAIKSESKICDVAFDEDSSILLCAFGRQIAVFSKLCHAGNEWTFREEESLNVCCYHNEVNVTSLAFGASNQLILAGCSNGMICVFQRQIDQHYRRTTPALSYTFCHSVEGHAAAVHAIETLGCTFPLCVVTASADSAIDIFHWRGDESEMKLKQILDDHGKSITGLAVVPHNACSNPWLGWQLYSASLDQTVKAWSPVPGLKSRIRSSTSSCSY